MLRRLLSARTLFAAGVVGLSSVAHAHPGIVEFRIRELTGQTAIIPNSTGINGDNALDLVVEARVTTSPPVPAGWPNHGLGDFSFSVVIPGEPEANGTFSRLRISNGDGSPYTGAPTTTTLGGGVAGMAKQWRYLVGLNAAFNGVFNQNSGAFNNGPDQEIGLIAGTARGIYLVGTGMYVDDGGSYLPVCPDFTVADCRNVLRSYFGSDSNWTQVYRFRYTATNLTPRVLNFTLSDVLAATFVRLAPGGTDYAAATQGNAAFTLVQPLSISIECNPSPPSGVRTVTICPTGTGSISTSADLFTAAPLLPGGRIEWHQDSCSGPIVGTGPTINVRPTQDTTYYPRAVGVDTSICNVPECLPPVTVRISSVNNAPRLPSVVLSPGPAAPVTLDGEVDPDMTLRWSDYTPVFGPRIVRPLQTTTYTAHQYDTVRGCTGQQSASVTVIVGSTPRPAPPVLPRVAEFRCDPGVITLTGQVPPDHTIDWRTDDGPIGSGTSLPYNATANTTIYAASRNLLTGAASEEQTTIVRVGCQSNNPPVVWATPSTIVPGMTSELRAVVADGWTVDWSRWTPSGYVPVASGLSVSVQPLSSTSYRAVMRHPSTGQIAGSTSASVTVDLSAGLTLLASPPNITTGGSSTLIATVDPGWTVSWYQSNCSGTPIATGLSVTVSPTVSTTFSAQAVHLTGAVSNCRDVRVWVNNVVPIVPPPSITASSTLVDPNTPVTLTASVPAGDTVEWFKDVCAGQPFATGNSVIVAPDFTTTYFARAVRPQSGVSTCSSLRIVTSNTTADGVEFRLREVTGQASITTLADTAVDLVLEARNTATSNRGISSFNVKLSIDGEPERFGTLERLLTTNPDGSLYVGPPTPSIPPGGAAGIAPVYRFAANLSSTFNGLINASLADHINSPDQDIGLVLGFAAGATLDNSGLLVPSTSGPLVPAIGQAKIDALNLNFGANNNWSPLYRFRYTTNTIATRDLNFSVAVNSVSTFASLEDVSGFWVPAQDATSPGYRTLPLTIPVRSTIFQCPADFDGSGTPDAQDILAFLNLWFAGSLEADFDRSGTLLPQDIFDFLNAWFVGC